MALTLTEQITIIQTQLGDDGTLFSTASLTAAVRQALRDFNQRAPVRGAEIVTVVSGIKTYELANGAFPTLVLDIFDVLKNDDSNEDDAPLEYDKIFEDNRIYIRLRQAEQSGNLLVRYTQPHTVNGLDSEVETTLQTDQDQILSDASCFYACLTRGYSIIESNNLTQKSVDDWLKGALIFQRTYLTAIQRYSSRPFPSGETRTTSWLDQDRKINQSTTSQAGQINDL